MKRSPPFQANSLLQFLFKCSMKTYSQQVHWIYRCKDTIFSFQPKIFGDFLDAKKKEAIMEVSCPAEKASSCKTG